MIVPDEVVVPVAPTATGGAIGMVGIACPGDGYTAHATYSEGTGLTKLFRVKSRTAMLLSAKSFVSGDTRRSI
jgi:hypothetical protein